MRIFLFLIISMANIQPAFASCFPTNNLFFIKSSEKTGISEEAFNKALDKVEKYYTPIVEARGAKLQINRLWKDETVNSDASQVDGKWIINSYGGLARFPGVTQNGYALVACHEMGHHLGGAPKYPSDPWASNEGEADYFATLKCAKAIGLSEKQAKAASLVLAKVLAQLGGESVPSEEKKDPKVVKSTYNDHPEAQCRLDTYLAGEVCQATGELSERDPSVNTCYPDVEGSRPFCWFKP